MSQFIGRGENFTGKVLKLFFPNAIIIPQYPMRQLIPLGVAMSSGIDFDTEIWKHKFDFAVIDAVNHIWLIVEVNYKHGDKSDRKWNNIFVPVIKQMKYIPVTIDDYECIRLFKSITNFEHCMEAIDDIYDALIRAGVKK